LSRAKAKNIDVEIYDQKYSIVLTSAITEGDVRRIADDVDARMREIAEVSNTADSLKIAILTALHLAQELRDLRKNSEQSDAVILKKSDEWAHVLEELLEK
jgi:cell division protein ZapA